MTKSKIILLLLFIISVSKLYTQQKDEIVRYLLKLDSTYLFIDNSNRNWYTIEIKADTFFVVENNLYYANNKTMQLNSMPFNSGIPTGAMGSAKIEEMALTKHKKWELEYQKKLVGKKLKSEEKFFYNEKEKPFLIWWFENPKKNKIKKDREIILYDDADGSDLKDEDFVELNVTHQLFLDFVIHGNTCVSISVPVLENENLKQEINQLENIANTLNVYGSYINLDVLKKRLDNTNFVIEDNKDLIEIKIPRWLNILQSPYENFISASFPEKDNVVNGVAVFWKYKSASENFDDFKKEFFPRNIDDNSLEVLVDEKDKERYFFTRSNSWFYCQNVFLEGTDVFCYINFTATNSTYNFNLERFCELINNIHLK
ncbi:hypothetical protein D0T49_08940 [Paludibacter sp. 221]|uniref:hypothetical protein n=1 Tax=Paludibacter sp. 221 TaxID=2302939 RepID=UPI0013D2CE38|nr:hypothetical protein [Paludibacter sp. 221]NDV47169.1 hypothetical protein [Paludibacter sp. 221]